MGINDGCLRKFRNLLYGTFWGVVWCGLSCFSIPPAFHCSISIETVMLNCIEGLFSCCTVWENYCWERSLQGELIVGKMLCMFSVVEFYCFTPSTELAFPKESRPQQFSLCLFPSLLPWPGFRRVMSELWLSGNQLQQWITLKMFMTSTCSL